MRENIVRMKNRREMKNVLIRDTYERCYEITLELSHHPDLLCLQWGTVCDLNSSRQPISQTYHKSNDSQ